MEWTRLVKEWVEFFVALAIVGGVFIGAIVTFVGGRTFLGSVIMISSLIVPIIFGVIIEMIIEISENVYRKNSQKANVK